MTFARRVFVSAGILGLAAIVPQYFLEDYVGRRFPPPMTHPEYFYGFVGLALVWQVMFLVIARDPVRYRPVMLIALLEKLSFGLPCIVLYLEGRIPAEVLMAGLFDLVLGVLFAISYRVTPARPVSNYAR